VRHFGGFLLDFGIILHQSTKKNEQKKDSKNERLKVDNGDR